MMRALLVLLLILLARAEAFEYVRQIRLDIRRYDVDDETMYMHSLVEIRMPGDSDLVVDSTVIGNGMVRLLAHAIPTAGRSDSLWSLRLILPNSDPAVICSSGTSEACLRPTRTYRASEIMYTGMADCFPQMESITVQGAWDLGSALISLRKQMNSVEDWGVYRTEEAMERTVGVHGGNPFLDLYLKDWYWESPWSRLDSLVGQGQWYRAEPGFKGSKGDTFVFLAAYSWYLKMRSGTEEASGLKVVGEDILTAPSYWNSCAPRSASAGTRRLLTGKSVYPIEGDSLQLDTLLRIEGHTYGSSRIILRTRIALKDLDSLLRNPPPVGIERADALPSALRLAGGRAELDAGTLPSRLELVDARGQILSNVSGTGRLSLALRGKGVRWVRWSRGTERGVLPTVF